MEMEKKLKKLNVLDLTKNIKDDWKNFVVSEINDHVVRLSILQRDFHWHYHSESDEMFYVIEGKLYVDLEGKTEEINPGEMITIPKNAKHRTRSNQRTLILCFESKENDVKGDK
jgi:mannose-6-phosphate isomerase-like protein (cupin superfamily)